MNPHRNLLATALLPAALTLPAAAQTPTAVVAASAGNPLALIPGQAGAEFSSFTQGQTRLSRTGRHWAVTVNATSLPSSGDTYVLVGTTEGITLALQEEQPLPGIGVGFLTRPDAPLGVNDKGELAFSGRLNVGGFSGDDSVVAFDRASGLWSYVAREGDPIPGVPGESFSSFLESVTLLDDGRVSFIDTSSSGATPSDQDEWLFLSGPGAYTVLAQVGTFAPTNQAGGTTALLDDIYEGQVSADGTSYLIEADLRGISTASERCLVVDGAVVLQEGQPVPGLTGLIASTFSGPLMFPGGDWAYNGGTTASESYLCLNGAFLIEGDAVPGGLPGEIFTQFRDVDANLGGDFAIVASTNRRSNVVVVLPADPSEAAYVALSTGVDSVIPTATQADIDGDCQLDDAYLVFVNDDTVGIAADRRVWLIGRFASAAGLTVADVLLHATPGVAVDCDFDGSADDCQIASNPLLDLDLDGALDTCAGPVLLSADRLDVSASEGGTQNLTLNVGPAGAGELFLFAGSATGSAPGTPFAGLQVPLVLDAYTQLLLLDPSVFSSVVGTLDGNGSAATAWSIPAGALSSSTIGLTLWHAYVTFDGANFTRASNAAALSIAP